MGFLQCRFDFSEIRWLFVCTRDIVNNGVIICTLSLFKLGIFNLYLSIQLAYKFCCGWVKKIYNIDLLNPLIVAILEFRPNVSCWAVFIYCTVNIRVNTNASMIVVQRSKLFEWIAYNSYDTRNLLQY